MWDDRMDRRTAMKRAMGLAAMALPVLMLEGCGNGSNGAASTGLSCTDVSNLSAADQQKRAVSQYVDHTPNATKPCSTCVHYEPATQPHSCGACKLVPGPVNPKGYCIFWSDSAA